jgi:cell division protein FtsI (penicillin-binding protein 3)
MKQNNKGHILWRYAMVVGFMLMFSAVIVWNMFKLTVVQAPLWNAKAKTVLDVPTTIDPARGKLLADNGTVLAANLQFYIARIDWFTQGIKETTLMENIDALCDSLASFDNSMTAAEWREKLLTDRKRILDAAKPDPNDKNKKQRMNRAYKLFNRMITHRELARLKTFPFLNLPWKKNGFYTESVERRTRPYGSMAARSIGSLDSTLRHGRSGLERALDTLLYGTPGVARNIQLTYDIVPVETEPAINGYDITTTINVQLQDIVEHELNAMCIETGAAWGTCVLMEVATGDIKAISNLERSTTDPNVYVESINHAVLGYEPGSVVKPISMMVALEDGIVTNIESEWKTGSSWAYAGGNPITDSHATTALSARGIIEMSSNIGMARIITSKYGDNPPAFKARLEEMGFFEPFNLGIAGEQTPVFIPAEVKDGGRVVLSRQAYGYASRIPPLCTLAMYNAIANDGKYVRPRLFTKLSREGEPDSIIPVTYIRKQVCSPENAAKLRLMLHDVVWGKFGTARKYLQDDNVEIAGKTGTAYEVINGQYGARKRLAFCGFFPYDKPKYSCIVLMLGADRGAPASSGLVLKNIALKMYAHGLLGNAPDYAESGKESKDNKDIKNYPTLYASMGDHKTKNLERGYRVKNSHRYARPAKVEKGVPNVIGLDIREAVKLLEDAGLSVSFSGTGMVVSQSVAAGSEFNRGQRVYLKLKTS